MRNLKKILALALALIMALSLMTVASAKSLGEYTDGATVSAEYATAVDFTTQIGVLQGMTENTYAPQGTLTRAQLATMIYRITTGDVAGKYVANFAAGAATQFEDVKGHWAAGYIAYCADAGYLKGVGNNKYDPNGTLTGYQALAALLRAIGYNQNNDFTGSDWTVKVAEIAYHNGIMEGVFTNLNAPLTREQAAQLVFNALWISKVTYYPAFGYNANGKTLVNESFDIITEKTGEAGVKNDVWGRPAKVWYATKKAAGYEAVVMADKALNSYTAATSECLVAIDMGLKADTKVPLWVNGKEYSRVINLQDVAVNLGGNGILIEVFADRIVLIDTYLGVISTAHPATYDVNGHEITSAYTDVLVYDNANGTATKHTVVGVGYTAGEKVLVNLNDNAAKNVVLGAAASVVGAQSYVYSDNARTVAGTKYAAAAYFNADATKAVVSTTNYTWYFDQYGNVIGSFPIATVYNYGVIEAIQWINPELTTGYALATIRYMDNTTANVKVAKLNGNGLTYATTDTAPAAIVGGKWVVSTSVAENTGFVATSLYAIEDKGNGTVELNAVGITEATTEGRVEGKVTTGVAKIANIVTDDATIYMVFNGKTFDYYTGYNSVITTKNAVTVDYVLGATGYAKYVYFCGSVADAQAAGLVQVKSKTWFYDNNTTTYTLTDAYVGGVQTPVVVNSTEFAKIQANTVYAVTYTNGVVTGTTAITDAGWTTLVEGQSHAKVLTVESVSGVNVVKTTDGNEWNVKDAAVYGEVKVGGKIVVVCKPNTETANVIFVIG